VPVFKKFLASWVTTRVVGRLWSAVLVRTSFQIFASQQAGMS